MNFDHQGPGTVEEEYLPPAKPVLDLDDLNGVLFNREPYGSPKDLYQPGTMPNSLQCYGQQSTMRPSRAKVERPARQSGVLFRKQDAIYMKFTRVAFEHGLLTPSCTISDNAIHPVPEPAADLWWSDKSSWRYRCGEKIREAEEIWIERKTMCLK